VSAHRDVVSKDWTEEEMETLSRMAIEGHSAKVIGIKLGRTRNSIIGRAVRKGIQLQGKHYPSAIKRVVKKEPVIKIAKAIKFKPKSNNLPVVRERPKPLGDAPPYLLIKLQDLKSNQCKWIVEKDFNDDYLYCGHPVVKDKSWCAHCSKVVFLPFTPMRKVARRHL
jgi:hypothetical protein